MSILIVQALIKIILISVALLSVYMLGMALSILIKKNGRFPAYQVGHNREMKKLGITCVKHDEIKCHRKNLKENGCAGCGSVYHSTS